MVMNSQDTPKFGKKAPVDPNAPKRPLSGYFFFSGEMRPELVEEGHSVTEISKIIGGKWKDLTEDDKAPYHAKSKKAKEKYAKVFAKYTKTESYQKHKELLSQWKMHMTKKSFKADPNRPKRPLSAYMMFMMDERLNVMEEQPDLKMTEISAVIGQKWKELSDEDRQPWVQKADKAKKQAQKKLEKYMKTEEYEAYQEEKAKYRKKMLAKRKALMKEMSGTTDEEEDAAPAPKKRKRDYSSDKEESRKSKKQKKKKNKTASSGKKKTKSKTKKQDSKSLKKSKKKKSDKKSKKSKSKKSKSKRQ